jgi:hypothetical protein
LILTPIDRLIGGALAEVMLLAIGLGAISWHVVSARKATSATT